MKELCGQSANYGATMVRGQNGDTDLLTAFPEIIIITSEAKYDADLGGLRKSRQVIEFRFSSTTDGLRELAKQLTEYADDADKWLASAVAKAAGKKAKAKQPDLPAAGE